MAINVGESAYKVEDFTKVYSLSFKVLLDKDTFVMQAYDLLGVPAYVLVDKKGEILFKDYHFPEAKIKELISK